MIFPSSSSSSSSDFAAAAAVAAWHWNLLKLIGILQKARFGDSKKPLLLEKEKQTPFSSSLCFFCWNLMDVYSMWEHFCLVYIRTVGRLFLVQDQLEKQYKIVFWVIFDQSRGGVRPYPPSRSKSRSNYELNLMIVCVIR